MPAYPSTPSFPLTFPATPKFRTFTGLNAWKTPATESPFTGVPQVFKYTGSGRIVWDATLPPMQRGSAAASAWIQFLMELQGRFGTFTLDLHAHMSTYDAVQGYTGLPTTWRSRESDHRWRWDAQGMLTGIVIKAMEA